MLKNYDSILQAQRSTTPKELRVKTLKKTTLKSHNKDTKKKVIIKKKEIVEKEEISIPPSIKESFLPALNEDNQSKYTLVLDLDETLVHFIEVMTIFIQ